MIQNEAHQFARKHGLQGEQRLDDALHAAGGDHPPRPGGNIKRSPLGTVVHMDPRGVEDDF